MGGYRAAVLTVALLAAAASAQTAGPATKTAQSTSALTVAVPASGVLVRWRVAARVRPLASSPVVRLLHQFRSDFRPTEVLAVATQRDRRGQLWVRLSLPM